MARFRIHKKFEEVFRSYATILKPRKQETAKAADAAKKLYNVACGGILELLEDNDSAQCGNYLIDTKYNAEAGRTITLYNGRVIDFNQVTYIMVGNETIKPEDIKTIYGGRAGYTEINVVPVKMED